MKRFSSSIISKTDVGGDGGGSGGGGGGVSSTQTSHHRIHFTRKTALVAKEGMRVLLEMHEDGELEVSYMNNLKSEK